MPSIGCFQDIHKTCVGGGVGNGNGNGNVSGATDPIGILYTADSMVTPTVQCKRCNLFLTSDGLAVVVHCTDCFEIPVTAASKTSTETEVS